MGINKKNIITGSELRVFEFAASAVVGLSLTPFIIHSLGDQMYGLWIFVGTFLGYYGLMDFGLNSAIQRFVSRSLATKDYAQINKIVNTSLLIFTAISFIILLVSSSAAFILPLWIKNIGDGGIFRVVILILGINFAIGFPLRVFSGILAANVRYDLSAMIDN